MYNFNKDFNKQLLTTSLVCLIIAVNCNLQAKPINIDIKTTANIYFGAGIGYNKYTISSDFKNIIESNQGRCDSSSLNLLTPILGMQFNNKYGVEFGYGIYNDVNFSGNKSGNLEIRNYFIDIIGGIPAPGSLGEEIDIIGGIGIGKMHLKENSSLKAMGNNLSYNKFGFRLKTGIQYPIDEKWNIRALFVYQKVGDNNGNRAIKNMKLLNIDLVYIT